MKHFIAFFLIIGLFFLQAKAQTDVTETYLVNPSFDDDTMIDNAPAGWNLEASSAGVQSKILKIQKGSGLIPAGQNHWQVLRSNLGMTAKAFQRIPNLPIGRYKLTAAIVPLFTGEAKFYLDKDSVDVITRENQIYEVEALVIGGEVELGIDINTTKSTTLDFDDFKLYQLEMSEDDYLSVLEEWHTLCVEDTMETDHQAWYNRNAFTSAFEGYEQVKTGETTIMDAISQLQKAHVDYQSITSSYKALKVEANALYEQTNNSKYAYADSIKSINSLITTYYPADEDHFAWVEEALASTRAMAEAYNGFLRLQKLGSLVRNQYNATEYEGKDVFAQSLSDAYQSQINAKTAEEFQQAISALEEAQATYLANRPSEWITIQNGNLWKTDTGSTVQAHAPGFVRVGDIWYMVGEDRSRQWNPDVNLYSSTDLIHWKYEKKVVQNYVTTPELGRSRMIERPKLLYNDKTGKFVIWCHYESSNYGASEAASFECDSVNGAYKYIWSGRPLNVKSRDCNVFQDTDGSAYFISTTEENQHLGLFKLDDEYHQAVSHTQLFAGQQREAPAIVRIGNRYFMFNSACSGWDPNQCKMAYTSNLTSGWTNLANVGNNIAYDTQAAAILEIKGTEKTTYLYVGDRWQDPGLSESKTIIFPIEFKGTTCTYTYHERFDINFVTGEWRETPLDDYFADKSEWTIYDCTSEDTNNSAKNAIDGDPKTRWQTKSGDAAPYSIMIDMGKTISIKGFLATPRMDSSSSGLIRNYEFLISENGGKWESVSSGSWLPYYTEVGFPEKECRYIQLICKEGTSATLADLDVVLYHDPTAIENVQTAEGIQKKIARRLYYSTDGRQISEPSEGVFIEKVVYTDGTSQSFKKLRR